MASYLSSFLRRNNGSIPKTKAFSNALKKYALAVKGVNNLEVLTKTMRNGVYSQELLNSIAKAFAANSKLKKNIGNPNTPPEAQIAALNNATDALASVTRNATNKDNLDKIMKQIFNSARGNTNEEKRSLYKEARYSKLNTNIALGSNTYGSFLASLKQNNSDPTRINALLAQVAAPEKNYTQMSTQNLLGESMKSNLSSANKKRLFEALQVERTRLGGLNNETSKTNRTLVQAAINRLKPKQLTVLNRVGGFARRAARALTGKTQTNSK
jgi:hypothetical protein